MTKKTKHGANQAKVLFHLKRLLHACLAVLLTIKDVSAPTEELKCLLNEKKSLPCLSLCLFFVTVLCHHSAVCRFVNAIVTALESEFATSGGI